ncbi:MAG: chloride channel protein [Gammaproteobacteria bacterium]|nr:chloride channel protein [Gammaproteobacteria bacterium]
MSPVALFYRIFSIALFGAITGAVASLASILFVEVVVSLNEWFMVDVVDRQKLGGEPWFAVFSILVPAAGGLVVGLICMTNREKRPLNLADTIQSTQTLSSDAPLKSGMATALASMVAIGSGASVGQYGPLAHMGATLGVSISRFTRKTGFTGTMGIGCGAAAAIATIFNAPIAGLIFAHEVILRHYSLKVFAPVTVSAVTGYLFANYVIELPPLFRIEFLTPIQSPEFLVFIAIGIVGAGVAALFMKLVLMAGSVAAKISIPGYLKPALAGTVLGMVSIWIPEVLGVGGSVLRNSILSAYTDFELFYILVAKMAMTALCLGFGFAGGIFSPALLVGVLFGALVGHLVPLFMIEHFSSIAVYAICGMVAVTSPVIGAPLTTILIVFELTRNYELTIAAMISVVFANLVGYRLMGRSIFDIQLKKRGFDLSLGRDQAVLDHRKISDFLSSDYVTAGPETTLETLLERMHEVGKSEGYIIDDNDLYLGTITTLQLTGYGSGANSMSDPCGRYQEKESIILSTDTTIWAAMEKIQNFVGESVPVVSSDGRGKLMGVVYEASIIQAYMETLYNIRREEYGAD